MRLLRYIVGFVLSIPVLIAAGALGTIYRLSSFVMRICDFLFYRVIDRVAYWIDLHVL